MLAVQHFSRHQQISLTQPLRQANRLAPPETTVQFSASGKLADQLEQSGFIEVSDKLSLMDGQNEMRRPNRFYIVLVNLTGKHFLNIFGSKETLNKISPWLQERGFYVDWDPDKKGKQHPYLLSCFYDQGSEEKNQQFMKEAGISTMFSTPSSKT
jgi:hypothetical protein